MTSTVAGVSTTGTAGFNQLSVTGVSTFTGNIDANGTLDVDGQTDLDVLNVAELATFTGAIDANGGGNITGGLTVNQVNVTGVSTFAGVVDINANVVVGTALTLASTGTITIGTGASISGDTSRAIRGRWVLGANGTNHYTFTGIGFTVTKDDPDLYLARGNTYEFVNGMGAHPFRIQTTQNGSTGAAYGSGVTGQDVSDGSLIFEVPFEAPDTLYYQCTAHTGMGGTIFVYPTLR